MAQGEIWGPSGSFSESGSFSSQKAAAHNAIMAALRQRDGRYSSSHKAEAVKTVAAQPMFQTDKYNGMLKKDARALRDDWVKTYTADMNQAYLDKLRGNIPPPVVNAPAVAAPSQGPSTPSAPPPAIPTAPTPSQPQGGVVPEAPAAIIPDSNGQVTGPPQSIPITSPWSNKAPQLQVGVTDPAAPVQYDYSHLQKQPLKSAAEQFSGATEASRALRAGVGSRYSGGGQNG